MNFEKSWAIATKDFAVFRRKPSIVLTLLAFPLGIAVGLPAVLAVASHRSGVSFTDLIPLLDSFAFFFVIETVFLANTLASYSIVGEKVEKSLEPLLATPATDSEILLGKTLAAFLPTIGATVLGATVFMVAIDAISHGELGYFYYPNSSIAVILLVTAPLACLFAVEANVLISSRAADIRAAQQAGGLIVLPFAALYVAGEIQAITLDTPTLLEVSLALLILVAVLFSVSRRTFRREEILTRWK
jgi:ABC-2 type transport system permease protein